MTYTTPPERDSRPRDGRENKKDVMIKINHQAGAVGALQLLGLLLVLMVAWLLWSGLYKPLLLILGLFSCLLSLWLARSMGFFRHALPLRSLLRLPVFWGWVLREVIKSSIDVARAVLSPSLPISPTLVELDAGETTAAGKVIVGNTITLSPGTVTIDLHEDRMLVHCLNRQAAEELLSSETQRRTGKLGIR
ncbi:MAG: Na+/H+ antiporter subunit E [Pseudomonadota bacterium]